MSGAQRRRGTFVERVLDGRARINDIEAEIAAWREQARGGDLATWIGVDERQLAQVLAVPESLRYVVHARRFGSTGSERLVDHNHVVAHAVRLVAEHIDPYDLADLETWREGLAVDGGQRAGSHA